MERHEGHWLNWYDTETLAPLQPAYVSTVDSGNLAGAFVALASGLREVAAGADGPSPGTSPADRARAPCRSDPRGSSIRLHFGFLYDADATALLDRLPAGRRDGSRPSRRHPLRPARVRGANRELPRHREGRRAGDALVPSRPIGHERARRPRAHLVERVAVRVPDAAAADAAAIRTRCSTCRAAQALARQIEYADAHRVPWGISESAYNRRRIGTGTISTRHSAFPVSD